MGTILSGLLYIFIKMLHIVSMYFMIKKLRCTGLVLHIMVDMANRLSRRSFMFCFLCK